MTFKAELFSRDFALHNKRFSGLPSRAALATFGFSVIVLLNACSGSGESDPLVENVKAGELGMVALRIDTPNDDTFVGVNKTMQLSASALSAGDITTAIDNANAWSSQNQAIATISKNGLLSATAEVGEVIISLSYAGFEATKTIQVSDAELIRVEVNEPDAVIDECQNILFTATSVYSDRETTNDPITWSLVQVESEIAEFADSSEGTLSTNDSGAVDVIATGENAEGVGVDSEPNPVTIRDTLELIEVDLLDGAELTIGDTRALTATGYYGEEQDEKDITANATFKSDDDGIARFEGNALTAVSAGSIAIEVGCGGEKSIVSIIVSEPDKILKSINIRRGVDDESSSIKPGDDPVDLAITASFEDESEDDLDYQGDALWSINQDVPVDEVEENVTIDSETGVVTVDDDFDSEADITITVEVSLLDSQGEVLTDEDGEEFTDTFALTIDVEDGVDP